MRAKLIHEAEERTFAVVFDKDDEVIGLLTSFAGEHAVSGAQSPPSGVQERDAGIL
jgi:hypothetical protein